MPELPEVETVRKVLVDWVNNKKIIDIECYYAPIIENTNIKYLNEVLSNKKIDSIDRIGKFLVFNIGEYVLLSHLRMEGKYYFYPSKTYDSKHIHLAFHLENGYLVYHDTRKFGKFFLTTKKDMFTNSPLAKLGLEPFKANKDYLKDKCKDLNCSIKEMLLDQSIMAGLGNIYADEVCYESKLLPFRKVTSLKDDDYQNIIDNSIKVLNKSIELGGSSVHSFSSGNHVDGKFQNELKVYGREGLKCFKCGSIITKMTLGGRGTCFCPVCQGNDLPKRPNIIGVSGLIGVGKSKISEEISKYGYFYIDCDKLTKQSYHDYDVLNDLRVKFYDCFVDNLLDKSLLRYKVNNDKKAKKDLENIIHPYVINEIKKLIKEHDKVVIEAALLFESKLYKLCDLNIMVVANERIRINRLKLRNPNYKEYSNLNNNIEDCYKNIKLCDYVIDNSLDLDNIYNQVRIFINKL